LHARTRIVLGGGVAGNRRLTEALASRMARHGATVYAPSPRLATDNAAMIARAGLFRLAEASTDATIIARSGAAIPGVEVLAPMLPR
jgi:N6-L-threonylcarbamoyladenine synthase